MSVVKQSFSEHDDHQLNHDFVSGKKGTSTTAPAVESMAFFESIREQWSVFLACRVCQFLSVTDLFSYLAALQPGGFADNLRPQRLRERLAGSQAAVFVSGIPVIGAPTAAVTSAVTRVVAAKASTSLIEPLFQLAVERVPPQQLFHWGLGAAHRVKHLHAAAMAAGLEQGLGLGDDGGLGPSGLAQGLVLRAWVPAVLGADRRGL